MPPSAVPQRKASPWLPACPKYSAPAISGMCSATMARLPPKPLQARTTAPYSTDSVVPSGRAKRTVLASISVTLAEQRRSTSEQAFRSAAIRAAPVFSGTACMRSALWPG
ncbi:hypothetical protein D3C83_29550 [compost metagenome]